jgi:hypothetical protein
LTDFDVSGLLLAKKVPNIYRIGIDFDTLDYFELQAEQVEEEYKPENNHMEPLRNNVDTCSDDNIKKQISYEKLRYLSSKRIEIDSVLAKVGNERFWDFVVTKLNAKFPLRNYNRSIIVPEFVIPDSIQNIFKKLEERLTLITAPERDKIIAQELSQVSGFIDNIGKKEQDIVTRFKKAISSDKDILLITERLDHILS